MLIQPNAIGLATEAKQDTLITSLAPGQKAASASLSTVMATGASLSVTGTLGTTVPVRAPDSGVVTVGTTALQLPSRVAATAILSWSTGNTGTIYVGTSSAVTAANAGFELDTNARSMPIEANNLNEYWVIASAAGQILRWVSS